MDRKTIGDKGEKLVAKHYKHNKYKIICINYTTRLGEIDIIAQKGELIIFIEVKTRKNADFMEARDAVNLAKQNRIKVTAQLFLQQYELQDAFVRFDVAEVYLDGKKKEINIIPDAF